MDKNILAKRISSILGDIVRLNNALYAMSTTDIQRYPDNYEVLSTDAALRAERIACRLRHLLYSAATVKKEEYLACAAEAHGVKIIYENNILEITLPCLIPGRKRHPSSEFLLDPIHQALENYVKGHELPKFQHCVICFSHIYRREGASGRVRDYDNLEMKQLLDVVASFVMTDDSGLLCDAYNTTELGEADCTRISIMTRQQFPEWLKRRQSALKTISNF